MRRWGSVSKGRQQRLVPLQRRKVLEMWSVLEGCVGVSTSLLLGCGGTWGSAVEEGGGAVPRTPRGLQRPAWEVE